MSERVCTNETCSFSNKCSLVKGGLGAAVASDAGDAVTGDAGDAVTGGGLKALGD